MHESSTSGIGSADTFLKTGDFGIRELRGETKMSF